jgi:glucose dehydrogenase
MPQTQQPSIVWQAQTGGRITGSPVIDGNGNLYIGCSDSKFYAINTQNGSIKWTYQSGSPILSTPAVSNIGLIYFGNHSGKVIAIDSSSNIHWFYQDSTSIDAPLLYERGTLYVGTVGARLLAFYDGADSSIYGLKKAGHANTNVLMQPPVWGTFQGNNQRTGVVFNGKAITGVKDKTSQLPTEYSLSQNYPNPFNPSTTISYQVASTGKISLKVYDLLGREVAKLVNEVKAQGSYIVTFNATKIPSGVYFYRLTAGTFTQAKKMLVVK